MPIDWWLCKYLTIIFEWRQLHVFHLLSRSWIHFKVKKDYCKICIFISHILNYKRIKEVWKTFKPTLKKSHVKFDILIKFFADRVYMIHCIMRPWQEFFIVPFGLSVTLFSLTYLCRSWRPISWHFYQYVSSLNMCWN